MQRLARYLGSLRRLALRFGPYFLVEILLPGGSLIALALFVYRQKRLPFGIELGSASAGVRRLLTRSQLLLSRMSIPGFAVRPG
jgi:hypothetical protein